MRGRLHRRALRGGPGAPRTSHRKAASGARFPGACPTPRAAATGGAEGYICAIIAWPKPEHDTCVASGRSRAKS